MKFKSFYYDGKSSNQNSAHTEILEDQIHIELEDGFKIVWDIEKIYTNGFLSGDKVSINYGEFPCETLEVFGKEFVSILKQNAKLKKVTKSIYEGLYDNSRKTVILTVLSIVFLVFLYLYAVPFAAEKVSVTIPYRTEKSIGEQITKSLLAYSEMNEEKSKLVNDFAKNIKFPNSVNGRSIELDIRVVEEDDCNAFAVMGGYIIIYRGLLEKIKTPEELAALLCHEYTHIYKKHSSKQIFRTLSVYFLISFLLNDYSGISAVIIQNADSLKDLQYSRSMETEADMFGGKIMIDNKINLKGMKELFKILLGNDMEIPVFFSTHPETKRRIDKVEEMINENRKVLWEKNKNLEKIWGKIKY